MSEDEFDTLPFEGTSPAASAGLKRIASVLPGRYQVQRELAAGSMGEVVLAMDKSLERLVAIKFSKPGTDIDRQEREARALAKLNSPHVVKVFDFQRTAHDQAYVVMEFVEGEDLGRRIQNGGAPPITEAVGWMKNVAAGMRASEEMAIVHRDLKPANILLGANGNALVSDFGLAYSPNAARLTHAGEIVGTPNYISPEQVEDVSSVDHRSDIYSFGAAFYHVLTGEPPFTSKSLWDLLLKHKMEPPAPPVTLRSEIPHHINSCLERCLAKNPADRYQSFGEIERQLSAESATDAWESLDSPETAEFLSRYKGLRDAILDRTAFDQGRELLFRLPSRRRLSVVLGDLVEQGAEAIVSSDDCYLTMGGGVSKAIRVLGGRMLEEETQRLIPARQGRVVVTSAGQLPARFVFHGITIDKQGKSLRLPTRDIVAELVDSCLYHAETFSVKSIAFPLLGTGAGRLGEAVALDTIFRVLLHRLTRQPTPIEECRIVVVDKFKTGSSSTLLPARMPRS